MDYKGTIIKESLADAAILKDLAVLSSRVEPVTEKHKTPWLKQWSLYVVGIPENRADEIAEKISKTLDYSHGTSWYADFKNKEFHYIIFKDKIFKVHRNNEKEYNEAKQYGMSLGIPEYQVDFSPEVEV